MDKLTYTSNLDNMREFEDSPRHQFIKGDICNQDLVTFVLKKYKPDYIINFAAESQVDRSINNPILSGQSNIIGTLSLLEGAKNIWKRNKFSGNKFIQISADDVYGSLNNKNDAFFEDSSLNPYTPFSATKAAADMLCQSYYKTYGLPVIITRCCNNYGPGQHIEKFIPNCIKSALDNKPIPLYGDGNSSREWIYVTDHAIALIRTLFYGKPGEIYNIGSGEEISNIDLARKVLSILNNPQYLIEKVKETPGQDCRYALNSYKIRNNLEWSHKMNLNEGLKDTILWYKDKLNI